MVYESYFRNFFPIGIKSFELIYEYKLAVIYLAVLQVLYDFEIAVEVWCIAVDDRYPKLILSFSVEVGQSDCSNNGVHVARSVANDHLQGWVTVFVEVA